MTTKIGIVGSRNRNTTDDYKLLTNTTIDKINKLWADNYMYGDIQIISGGQMKGADGWAEGIALEQGLPIKICYPDWNRYGKVAGPVRNTLIARESDILIACLGQGSKGTQDTIDKFKKLYPKGELVII